LPSIYNDKEKQELALLEIDEMWKKILEFEDFNGEKMFPHLELLVQAVLSFPHSPRRSRTYLFNDNRYKE